MTHHSSRRPSKTSRDVCTLSHRLDACTQAGEMQADQRGDFECPSQHWVPLDDFSVVAAWRGGFEGGDDPGRGAGALPVWVGGGCACGCMFVLVSGCVLACISGKTTATFTCQRAHTHTHKMSRNTQISSVRTEKERTCWDWTAHPGFLPLACQRTSAHSAVALPA